MVCDLWGIHQCFTTSEPIRIHCDNQATILLVTADSVNSGRTKHIDIRYKFAREHHRDFKNIEVVDIPSEANGADGLTRPVLGGNHDRFFRILNPSYFIPKQPAITPVQLLQVAMEHDDV